MKNAVMHIPGAPKPVKVGECCGQPVYITVFGYLLCLKCHAQAKIN